MDKISQDSVNIGSALEQYVAEENDKSILPFHEWEKYQDSLRKVILLMKENKVLKGSFLEEMYIRDVVYTAGESLYASISFNLHAPDCGAPDCYSTDIRFSFIFEDSIVFPEYMRFTEHEHGCTEREIKISGRFKKIEETRRHVIFHSEESKRTLVLFSSYKDMGTMAHYYTEIGKDKINGRNLYDILNKFKEEDSTSIFPFASWVLTTNEYEHFMPD